MSGYRVQGFLGMKAGARVGRAGLYAKARPGFLYFERDPFGVALPGSTLPQTRWASSFEPALDLGLTMDCDTPSGLIVRFDVGDTVVRYDSRMVVSSQHVPSRSDGGVATEKVGRVRTCRLGTRRLTDEAAGIGQYRQMVEARLNRLGDFLERTKETDL